MTQIDRLDGMARTLPRTLGALAFLVVTLTCLPACGASDAGGASTGDDAMGEVAASEAGSSEGEAAVQPSDAATGAPAVAGAPAGSPLATFGPLHVEGTALATADGSPVQLRGVSTHGLAWFPQYVNGDAFATLRDDWGANCVRLALYTAEYDGYAEGGDQAALKDLVRQGVDAATDLGLYVIIDWHVLHDLSPLTYMDQAKAFFDEMSAAYADHANVLYEICNEPNGDTSWADVKSYAEQVIPVIRANAPDAENVLYSLHFYAATHGQWLRDRMVQALDAGLPIFISEFGTPDASGSGANDLDSADAWLDLADERHVSYCCWSLSNKDEAASLLAPTSTATSGWADGDSIACGRSLEQELVVEHLEAQRLAKIGIVGGSEGTHHDALLLLARGVEAHGTLEERLQRVVEGLARLLHGHRLQAQPRAEIRHGIE